MQIDQMLATGETNENGKFLIQDVPNFKSTYIIQPHVYDDLKEGLDPLDLVLLIRHVTGYQKFTDVLEYAAADVNSDAVINMDDYWTLATRLYDLPNRKAEFSPWKWIDQKLIASGINKASKLTVPIELDVDRGRYDILGLKTGDINYSWGRNFKSERRIEYIPFSRQSSDNRSHVTWNLRPDRLLEALSIRIINDHIGEKFQFSSMGFDMDQTIVEETPGGTYIHFIRDYKFNADYQEINIEIDQGGQIDLDWGYAVVGSSHELSLQEIIWENNVEFDEDKITFNPIITPNPVHNAMYIHLPNKENYVNEVSIYDVHGRVQEELRIEDLSSIRIDHIERLSPGVYFLRFELSSGEPQIHSFIKN
jgi:hypothetical protein